MDKKSTNSQQWQWSSKIISSPLSFHWILLELLPQLHKERTWTEDSHILSMISTAITNSTSTRVIDISEAMESQTGLKVTNTMITCIKQHGWHVDKAINRKKKLSQDSKTYSIHLTDMIHNMLSMNDPRYARNSSQ